MRRRTPLLALIAVSLFAVAAVGAAIGAEEGGFFAPATLGALPGSSLGIGWAMAYRGAMPHSAFAYAQLPDGRATWNFVAGRPDAATAEAEALARCNEAARRLPSQPSCRIAAIDGAPPGSAAPRPAMAVLGPFRASPLHRQRGPAQAEGVVIYGHGTHSGQNLSEAPAQGWLSAFNDAGWDVFRFDRGPSEDQLNRSVTRLIDGVKAARAAGYRRIILAGQSRGAWQSLVAAASVPVEGVIAISPAAHGQRGDPNNRLAGALDDWRRLLAALPDGGPRVVVTIFENDDYDPDMDRRLEMLGRRAAERTAPLAGFNPTAPLSGHGGARDWRFTRDWSACLLAAMTGAEAPRGVSHTACAPAIGAVR
ncbi:hypothetical protein IAI18_06220 [Acetobacteraceae bacterium H6797]|nr:hypothetical protein [Acetobacteraceae bacterium H6797]